MNANVVLAVILRKDGRLLALRRRSDAEGLTWVLPGGKRESGEDEARAAEREAFEETGLRTLAVERLGERVHPITHQRIAYWICQAFDGTAHHMEPDKAEAVAWIPAEEFAAHAGTTLFPPLAQRLGLVPKR